MRRSMIVTGVGTTRSFKEGEQEGRHVVGGGGGEACGVCVPVVREEDEG
jgi:hypothetical protein